MVAAGTIGAAYHRLGAGRLAPHAPETKRENMIDIGLLKFVRRYETVVVDLDTGIVEPEAIDIRYAPDRPQQRIDRPERASVLGMQKQSIRRLFDACRNDLRLDVHAVIFHCCHQLLRDSLWEAR